MTRISGEKILEKTLKGRQTTKDILSAIYIAKVLGKISPKKRIRVPLTIIASTSPLLPRRPTKSAVEREESPILTSKLPNTMAERRWVGFLRRFFTTLAWGYFSESLRNLMLLKEKIAVSEPEKKADKPIKITKIKTLNSIFASDTRAR
jgi:hypothetical protein